MGFQVSTTGSSESSFPHFLCVLLMASSTITSPVVSPVASPITSPRERCFSDDSSVTGPLDEWELVDEFKGKEVGNGSVKEGEEKVNVAVSGAEKAKKKAFYYDDESREEDDGDDEREL